MYYVRCITSGNALNCREGLAETKKLSGINTLAEKVGDQANQKKLDYSKEDLCQVSSLV